MTNTSYTRSDLLTLKLLSAHRAAHPASRAVSLVRLVANTSSRKQYGCVLCGAEGPTFSARYPETKRSSTWRLEHVAKHLAAAERAIADARTPEEMVAHDAELEERHDLASAIRAQAAS